MFFRVILFGAPKPRVSVSALKRPVFCYLLIILFYLHLPNKIIFPHGLLISFHSFHYAQQGLQVHCKISLFLIWKPPNYYLFSCSFAFVGNRRKETCSAVLQDKSNGLLWRGKPRKSSHSHGFGFCFQIWWAWFPVNIWNYFPANNLKTKKISESVEMPILDVFYGQQKTQS